MFFLKLLQVSMHNQAIKDILHKLPDGISLAHVAAMAGINPSHLTQINTGKRMATASTFGRVRLASVRIKARQSEGNPADNALFRALLVIAATELGIDPALAQNSEPTKRLTANKDWRNAAYARWIARYLMNTTFGFTMTDIGKAEGVTKAAVSASMPEIENRRDDNEFDAMLTRIEQRLLGGA